MSLEHYDYILKQEQHVNRMKAQERLAIQALIQVNKQVSLSKGTSLDLKLEQAANEMKNYVATTYVSNIQEGFEGLTADRAEEYLTQGLQKPSLESPIRA